MAPNLFLHIKHKRTEPTIDRTQKTKFESLAHMLDKAASALTKNTMTLSDS